jgi:FixJ family two-component response regulator
MHTDRFVTFVVDDDKSVLRSLSRLLTTEGYEVRPYLRAEQFLAEHDASVPGCAILDMSMPELDGLELQGALAAVKSDRPVIFLSGVAEVPSTVQAMKAGAVDFLTKPVRSKDLLAAIEAARNKQATGRDQQTQRDTALARIAKLTPRERQVMEHVVAGRLNKQIAADLGISLKTVKLHRGAMMRKMGVRAVADLVRLTEAAKPKAPPQPSSAPS